MVSEEAALVHGGEQVRIGGEGVTVHEDGVQTDLAFAAGAV